MVLLFCPSCRAEAEPEVDEAAGFAACAQCGRVLDEGAFSTDVQFVKGADGEGELVGQFVPETGQPRGLTRVAGGRTWAVRVSMMLVCFWFAPFFF
jgi:transcription factor IIIB subunit 2